MKLATTLGVLLALSAPAAAETITYACQVADGPRVHLQSAQLDTTKKTITWRGLTYSNLKDVTEDDCAKQCFRATRHDGTAAVLSTATQGAATLTLQAGPPPLPPTGIEEHDCDLVRQ